MSEINEATNADKFVFKQDTSNLPEKMVFERNQDGTYKANIEGLLITDDKKTLLYKGKLSFPKVQVEFSNDGLGFLSNFIRSILADNDEKKTMFSIEIEENENDEDVAIKKYKNGGSKMIINEVQGDLFAVPQGYYLAHCISGDYALAAGIAKEFDKVYNMRFKLHRNYAIADGEKSANIGKALLVDNVFNLVTKERCFHKPTYDTLYGTLVDMKEQCENFAITKLAMPLIGCGLDKLDWRYVKDIIEDVFDETDIEILICKL